MRSARSVTKLAVCTASILALTVASLGLPALAQDAVPAVQAPATQAAPAPPVNPLSESVAAVVNDDIVSSYDLMQRMRLLMVTSGLQPTQENLPQLEQEALRSLIDEHVQMQELHRVEKAQKITIISTDKEVDEQIEDIAKGNNMTGAQLAQQLAAQGVGVETWKAQIRADSSWQAWISGRYGSRLRIGDGQIKAFERRQAEAASKPQYQVSEVFIDAVRVGGMETAQNGAKQLVPDAAGRAFPGRSPPVLGLADRGQWRRRWLDQPGRDAARGRRRARAAASRSDVGPDPGARWRLHHLSA